TDRRVRRKGTEGDVHSARTWDPARTITHAEESHLELMADDVNQARLQRIEDHLRSLDARVSVLSAVDSGEVKKRIAATFSDPRMVIIYRGVQAGLTQQQIAE